MHSRIFQVSNQPIPLDEYVTEEHYYDHWFTSSVADYVDDNTDRDDDIRWFKELFHNHGLTFGADEGGEFFIVADKDLYFGQKFDEFKSVLKQLSKATLEQFVDTRLDMTIYRFNNSYDDKSGFYTVCDGYTQTLDALVRESQNGEKLYIGASLDYHF